MIIRCVWIKRTSVKEKIQDFAITMPVLPILNVFPRADRKIRCRGESAIACDMMLLHVSQSYSNISRVTNMNLAKSRLGRAWRLIKPRSSALAFSFCAAIYSDKVSQTLKGLTH